MDDMHSIPLFVIRLLLRIKIRISLLNWRFLRFFKNSSFMLKSSRFSIESFFNNICWYLSLLRYFCFIVFLEWFLEREWLFLKVLSGSLWRDVQWNLVYWLRNRFLPVLHRSILYRSLFEQNSHFFGFTDFNGFRVNYLFFLGKFCTLISKAFFDFLIGLKSFFFVIFI